MATRLISARQASGRLPAGTNPPAAAFQVALPWLLGSLALTIVALVRQVPPWSLVVFGCCALWRYLIARRGGALPSMVVRLLVFLPVAACVLLKYGTNPGASGMLTFLIALLSLKILELRSERDFTVVSLLGYFMVLSGFFYDQSLLLSLYLCATLLVNTVALIHCHSGGQRRVAPALRLALGMSAQALPLVVLLFVIFPRLQASFLHRFSGASTGLTGMSEHLQPGSFSTLAQSDAPAFRAKIGGGGVVAQHDLYWRGLVLDACEASLSWKASAQVPRTNGGVPPPGPGSRQVEQQITLFANYERWLFALDRPLGVRPSSNVQAQLYTSDVLQNRDRINTTAYYTAVSDTSPADATMPLAMRRYYTQLPSDVSERAQKLATSWRATGRTDEDVIHAARQFFRDGGFTYTLSPGVLPKDDPLDFFLFSSHRGFCEHYAAAFTTLMRAAGLPARIVIGYQGGEYNSWGGHYLIRQSDAHAWSEVWVDNKRWQREDPTAVVAPDRVSYGTDIYSALAADGALSDEARLERLNALNAPGWHWLVHHGMMAWDGLDQEWNVAVLGYDQDKQQTAFQKLGVDNISWLWGTAWTLTSVFTILILGTVVMRAINRGPAVPRDPVQRLYERFCRRVAAVSSVRRDPAEGPLDFARRATVALPGQAAEIRAVTELYVTARYAQTGTAQRAAAAFRAAVRVFRPHAHSV